MSELAEQQNWFSETMRNWVTMQWQRECSKKIAVLDSKQIHVLEDDKILTSGIIISTRKDKKEDTYLIFSLRVIFWLLSSCKMS